MEYSVLMSVYQKENATYFRESIESMLTQSVMPSDFVLVCDGPLTQALDAVIVQYAGRETVDADGKRRKLFQILRLPENVGLGRALNEGLKACRYDIVARMDSDDISLSDRCEKQLKTLTGQKLDVVSGALVEFSDAGRKTQSACASDTHARRGSGSGVTGEVPGNTSDGRKRVLPQSQEEILRFARRRNPFNHPCVMYRKSSVQKAGGYVHCEGFEDYHLWVRMLQSGMRGANLPDVILRMRVSGMYERRGGLHYAGNIIRFRFYLWRTGFCSFGDFLYAVVGHVGVSLLPNRLRQLFYDKMLRG